MTKFENIPKDKNTRIIGQDEITLGNISALRQRWSWDGILADSIIFKSDDVSHLDDDSLQKFINHNTEDETHKVTGSVTFKRNHNGYCFVNFNFVSF